MLLFALAGGGAYQVADFSRSAGEDERDVAACTISELVCGTADALALENAVVDFAKLHPVLWRRYGNRRGKGQSRQQWRYGEELHGEYDMLG